VDNAGLILQVTLAHHLGLGELMDRHADLGEAPGQANAGDKLLTLAASALAGGDCIDDAHALRAVGINALPNLPFTFRHLADYPGSVASVDSGLGFGRIGAQSN